MPNLQRITQLPPVTVTAPHPGFGDTWVEIHGGFPILRPIPRGVGGVPPTQPDQPDTEGKDKEDKHFEHAMQSTFEYLTTSAFSYPKLVAELMKNQLSESEFNNLSKIGAFIIFLRS